jgi:uncharacterized protein (TIGR02001 family)
MRVIASAWAVASLALAGAGHAQIDGQAAIVSDDQYRGLSVSGGRAALELGLSYDSPFGVYAETSAAGARTADDGPQLVSVDGALGWARRFPSDVTADVGVTDYRRFAYDDGRHSTTDLELYSGLRRHGLYMYLYYSPHYYLSGWRALYPVAGFDRSLGRSLHLFGHVGVLARLDRSGLVAARRPRPDAEVGLRWRVRGLDLFVAATGARSGPTEVSAPITAGVSRAF